MEALGGMRAAGPSKSSPRLGAPPDGAMLCRLGKNIREPEGWRGLGTHHPDGESL